MTKARILLADDHSLILEGIRKLLESQYDIVGVADNGGALVREAARTNPDLVVLDVSMPILNGIDAGREIRKTQPKVKLVFISMHSNAIYVRKAMEVGASGYVLKSGASEELLTAIEQARQGRTYFSPGLSHDVIENLDERRRRDSRRTLELTSRQRQILQMIAEGKQNKEIAGILYVSVRTVEFHRSRLMSKLGARTVAELTRFAIQEGLIGPLLPKSAAETRN
ncbi:MAG: response regulator [Acidobacteriota bacterium]